MGLSHSTIFFGPISSQTKRDTSTLLKQPNFGLWNSSKYIDRIKNVHNIRITPPILGYVVFILQHSWLKMILLGRADLNTTQTATN